MGKAKYKIGDEVFTFGSPHEVIGWLPCDVCDCTGEVVLKGKSLPCPRPGCTKGTYPVFGRKVKLSGPVTSIKEIKHTYLDATGKIKKVHKIQYLCDHGQRLADFIAEDKLFPTRESAQAEVDRLNGNKN